MMDSDLDNDPGGNRLPGTSFIGSFLDTPDQAVIVLRGDIDAAALERLGVHLRGVLNETGARFVTLDAAAVDSYDPGLLGLLGRTQQRLSARRGLLQVRGLHPRLLPDTVAAAPAAAAPAAAAPAAGSIRGSRTVPEPAS